MKIPRIMNVIVNSKLISSLFFIGIIYLFSNSVIFILYEKKHIRFLHRFYNVISIGFKTYFSPFNKYILLNPLHRIKLEIIRGCSGDKKEISSSCLNSSPCHTRQSLQPNTYVRYLISYQVLVHIVLDDR